MKTPITWLELLKKKFKEIKELTGKSASVSEVAGDAKKEWIKIKEGTHNKYVQGKSLFFSKKTKTKKHHSAAAAYTDADIRKIVAECPKCSKKLNKFTLKNGKKNRNLKGGTTDPTEMDATHEMDAAAPVETPVVETPVVETPDVNQSGGKKGKRKSRKSRK